ncbi:MAG: hypothetical protein LBL83_10485, partial [Clostridiales bacterium]|nr:hypothetical protein [Clostridiales bacterium]
MIEKNYCAGSGALWDFWVVPHGGIYHLYYLQDERDAPAKNDRRWSIGHAVSADLERWRECGIALRACPELGIHGLATGSALWLGDGGIMAVTACSGAGGALVPGIGKAPPYTDYGIAFARSDDMHRWSFVGAPALFPGEWPFEPLSAALENPPGCFCFGDPWLYALPGDSRAHILLNARLRNGGMRTRGAVAHTATADFASFEALRPIAAPGIASRLETPQLFAKNGRWYLIASCGDALLDPAFISARGPSGLAAASNPGGADAARNSCNPARLDAAYSVGGLDAAARDPSRLAIATSNSSGLAAAYSPSGLDTACNSCNLARLDAAAIVFTADSPDGPFELAGSWALFPGEGCYICKAVPEADSILTIRCTATQYPPKK